MRGNWRICNLCNRSIRCRPGTAFLWSHKCVRATASAGAHVTLQAEGWTLTLLSPEGPSLSARKLQRLKSKLREAIAIAARGAS